MVNKLKYYAIRIGGFFLNVAIWFWVKTPWYKAFTLDSFRRYLESDWYKERREILTKAQALNMYFDSHESWFFRRKVTRKERIQMMICPFSAIEFAKKSFRKYEIHDYL